MKHVSAIIVLLISALILCVSFCFAEEAEEAKERKLAAVATETFIENTNADADLSISVDRESGATYLHGENVEITVESQITGYLVIYDFMPDGNVHRIFPNDFQPDNFILSGQSISLPGPFGYKWVVGPPDGEEFLLAIVTRTKVETIPDAILNGALSDSSIATFGMNELAKTDSDNYLFSSVNFYICRV